MSHFVTSTETSPCLLCTDPALRKFVSELRGQGHGYKYIWRVLNEDAGCTIGHHKVQAHCAHVEAEAVGGHFDGDENGMRAIGQIEDEAKEVTLDWFEKNGIEIPPGFVAGTIEVKVGDKRHWLRVKPLTPPSDRIEVRQAEPIIVQGPRPSPMLFVPGNWRLYAVLPDGQIGYWMDSRGRLRPTHDERSFDLGHQIISWMADQEPIYGIADCGDFLDLSAAGRWDPTFIDTNVQAINHSFQRAAQELAWRRWIVGDDGRVIVLSGNHDLRLQTFANKAGAWLVGLQRPGEEDDWPIFSVPYLVRSKEYGVEWVENFPGSYYKLNDNLVVMHSPRLASKPLDTARQIATTIHASVVHGHSHRSERASFNLETTEKGVRTFTVWSSGCWARIDGGLPSGRNSRTSFGDRIVATDGSSQVGTLSENFHQGFDFVWVEQGGRQRWSAEHVDFWGPWAQFRGREFHAVVNVEGDPVVEQAP
jgi:hypothetical protein